MNKPATAAPLGQEATAVNHVDSRFNCTTLPTEAREAFLRMFPDSKRSHATNLFLFAVRSGAKKPADVLSSVRAGLAARVVQACSQKQAEGYAALLQIIRDNADRALEFARYCRAYEALPQAEKQALKQARAAEPIARYMAAQPPTERQIRYLRYLGYAGEIPDRRRASELIDVLQKGRG